MADYLPLGDITELITKGTTPSTLGGGFASYGINFVKVESISEGGIIIKEKLAYIDEATHAKLARSVLRKDDILFSIAGAIGRTTRVTESVLPANTNQALAIIRVDQSKACVDYVHQCVQGDAFIKTCSDKSVKSAQANVSLGSMAKAMMYLPPLAEQRKIAEILRTWDEAIETAEAELKAKQERKRGLMQKLLNLTAEGAGALTANWETVCLGDICVIERGGSPRPISEFITNDENGVNWVKITDATASGKCIYSTEEKIIPEGVKRSRMVHPGDFILSNSMSFGRPYIMKTTGCIHDGWLALRNPKADTDFLYFILSSEVVSNQFESLAAGSTVRNLNVEIAKKVKIPLPPLAEQRKIAEVLQSEDEAIDTLKAKAELLRTQKRGLMQKLLTGEVRVNP